MCLNLDAYMEAANKLSIKKKMTQHSVGVSFEYISKSVISEWFCCHGVCGGVLDFAMLAWLTEGWIDAEDDVMVVVSNVGR